MHCEEVRRRGINGPRSYPVSGSVISFEVEMADNDIETESAQSTFIAVFI